MQAVQTRRRASTATPLPVTSAESAPTTVAHGQDVSSVGTARVVIGPLVAITSYTLTVYYWTGTAWVVDPGETVTLSTTYVRDFDVAAASRIAVIVSAITGTSVAKTLSVG